MGSFFGTPPNGFAAGEFFSFKIKLTQSCVPGIARSSGISPYPVHSLVRRTNHVMLSAVEAGRPAAAGRPQNTTWVTEREAQESHLWAFLSGHFRDFKYIIDTQERRC